MGAVDPYALNLNSLFVEAAMFRLTQADPTAADSITIRGDVFDRLMAVVEAASRASALPPAEQLTAHAEGRNHLVTLSTKAVGEVHAEGRTLLEAIVKAKLEMDCEIERASIERVA